MKWNVWHIPSGRWLSTHSWGRKSHAQATFDHLIEIEGYDAGELEVRRVLPMLEANGTQLMKLKPKMIWDCAMADMARRERNKDGRGRPEHYAFHRKHVLKAESANDIIRAAIKDIDLGRRSAKRDTRLIYSDPELLKEALR